MKRVGFFLALSLLLIPAISQAFSGRCIKVSDGDTITVLTAGNNQVKVRLYGIDCPERRQAFGKKAKAFTSALVAGKQVEIERVDIDRYGRTVGIIWSEDQCVNVQLLKSGYAWLYTKYCKADYCQAWKAFEWQARADQLGLWADPQAIAPWEYRKRRRK